jgi:UDP-N-acetylglucosamine--N-acetylmuramyl-(pentapeptide) pyrophosphoryl-undecaprenol N-acetylglucosamine transferase
MSSNNKKILIATGGTGGHIFPSLSLANFLKTKYELHIITDKRGLKYLDNKEKINIKTINSGTVFKKNLFQTFVGIIKVFFSFISSTFYLIILRPQLVIGMGGYSSFPVCVASYCLRIPVIIYENNLVIGRANKFLLSISKAILVATSNVQGIDPKYKKKVFSSGYLIRSQILNLKKDEIQNSEKKNLSILITGGSQSAKIFGEILPNIITRCCEKGIKFKIYQQCLDKQIDQIKKLYEKSKLEFELFSFSDDISKYFKKADLAITRSGASSLAELVNLRIPFIAIPLPSSADNHQFENANYFSKKGYCFLLEEKFVSDKLFEILADLNKDIKKLFLMKERMAEHSDKDVFSKTERVIKKILNEQN